MFDKEQIRIYNANDCITFRKTSETFGGLSNMAPDFVINIGDTRILTSEALYQACRFPNHPDIQRMIIDQRSPMTAKEISKQYIDLTREDWEKERINIMRWSLRMKLICNWYSFGELLVATSNKAIVENSARDIFWGAAPDGDKYVGVNALGRLLMQLRELYQQMESKILISLQPPKVSNFKIFGKPVETLTIDVSKQPYNKIMKMW